MTGGASERPQETSQPGDESCVKYGFNLTGLNPSHTDSPSLTPATVSRGLHWPQTLGVWLLASSSSRSEQLRPGASPLSGWGRQGAQLRPTSPNGRGCWVPLSLPPQTLPPLREGALLGLQTPPPPPDSLQLGPLEGRRERRFGKILRLVSFGDVSNEPPTPHHTPSTTILGWSREGLPLPAPWPRSRLPPPAGRSPGQVGAPALSWDPVSAAAVSAAGAEQPAGGAAY